MKAVEAGPNVVLRRDQYGHESVVFAFPYRADVVDAVRAIPGRRFDWEAKEWWAPQADATAPYVKGVLERHPWLVVDDEVELWLARAVTGWVGRVSALATTLSAAAMYFSSRIGWNESTSPMLSNP